MSPGHSVVPLHMPARETPVQTLQIDPNAMNGHEGTVRWCKNCLAARVQGNQIIQRVLVQQFTLSDVVRGVGIRGRFLRAFSVR